MGLIDTFISGPIDANYDDEESNLNAIKEIPNFL